MTDPSTGVDHGRNRVNSRQEPRSAHDQRQSDGEGGLGPEDAKLVTLARAARARSGATEGAAVRDGDGRTYAAVAVALPSLTLSALQVAVAMAVSSGATSVEAAAVVGDATASSSVDLDDDGMAALRDLGGSTVHVIVSTPDGDAKIVSQN